MEPNFDRGTDLGEHVLDTDIEPEASLEIVRADEPPVEEPPQAPKRREVDLPQAILRKIPDVPQPRTLGEPVEGDPELEADMPSAEFVSTHTTYMGGEFFVYGLEPEEAASLIAFAENRGIGDEMRIINDLAHHELMDHLRGRGWDIPDGSVAVYLGEEIGCQRPLFEALGISQDVSNREPETQEGVAAEVIPSPGFISEHLRLWDGQVYIYGLESQEAWALLRLAEQEGVIEENPRVMFDGSHSSREQAREEAGEESREDSFSISLGSDLERIKPFLETLEVYWDALQNLNENKFEFISNPASYTRNHLIQHEGKVMVFGLSQEDATSLHTHMEHMKVNGEIVSNPFSKEECEEAAKHGVPIAEESVAIYLGDTADAAKPLFELLAISGEPTDYLMDHPWEQSWRKEPSSPTEA